jgi:hypothetical protein
MVTSENVFRRSVRQRQSVSHGCPVRLLQPNVTEHKGRQTFLLTIFISYFAPILYFCLTPSALRYQYNFKAFVAS